MSITFLDTILDEINEKIEPTKLIEKLNYFPEKSQIIGPSLKAFCPIHQEKVFRSLIIDINKKTYKCSLKTCQGFQGGNLIDFYAKLTNQSYLKSALSLVELLNLPIDTEMIIRISNGFYEEANKAFASAKLADAEKFCLQALDIEPANIESRLLLAKVYESQNRIPLAVDEFLKVIDGYINVEKFDSAIDLLQNFLLKRDPNNEEFLLKAATIAEKQNDVDKAIEFLLSVAEIRDQIGELDKNLDLFKKILNLKDNRDDVRYKLANLYETLKDIESASTEYLILAKFYKGIKSISKAIDILYHVKEIKPLCFEARELLGEYLLSDKRAEEAEKEYLELAGLYLEKIDYENAQIYYSAILENNPKSIKALSGLANLLTIKEEKGKAAEIYDNISQVYFENNDIQNAIESLKNAKQCNDEQPKYSEKLAEFYFASGNIEAGIDEYFYLADFYLERNENKEAVKILSAISSKVPEDTEKRLKVANVLISAHMSENALNEYVDLAKTLKQLTRYNDVERVCKIALQISDQNIFLNETLLESYLELDLNAEAIEQYKKLYDLYKVAGEEKLMTKLLEEALELSPNDIFFHQELSAQLIAKKKIKEALPLLKKLSTLLHESGRADELILNCQLIIKYNPDDIEAHKTLSNLYHEMGDIEQAIFELDQVAEIYKKLSQKEDAINTLKNVLSIEPQHMQTLKKIAEWIIEWDSFENAKDYLMTRLENLKQIGTPDEIIKEYKWILGLSEGQDELQLSYADYLVQVDSINEAIKEYINLLEIFLEKKKEYNLAIQVCLRLNNLQPNNYNHQAMLGYVYSITGQENEAINYYRLAAEGYDISGDEIKALECYGEILRINPSIKDIRNRRAILFEHQGRMEDAINDLLSLSSQYGQDGDTENLVLVYEKILSLDETRLNVRRNLSKLYEDLGRIKESTDNYLLLATHLRLNGNNNEAIQICVHLKELTPEKLEVRKELIDLYKEENLTEKLIVEYSEIADICIKNNDYANCEKYLVELGKLAPFDASVLERLAALFEAQGEIEKACREYAKLSDINYESGNIDMAISWLEKIKDLNPSLYDTREKLSMYYVEAGNINNAINEYLSLSKIYFEMQNLTKGESLSETACRLEPFNTNIRIKALKFYLDYLGEEKVIREICNNAAKYLENKEFEKTLILINHGLNIDNENTKLKELKINAYTGLNRIPDAVIERLDLAKIYFKSNKYFEAENHYLEILKIEKNNFEAHYQLVECYLKTDRKSESLDLLDHIAELYIKKGDNEQAIHALKRVIELEPERLNSRLRYAELLEKSSKTSEAISQYDILIDSYINNKNAQESERLLLKVLDLDSMRLDTHKKLILFLNTFKGIQEARKRFREYIELCNQLLNYEQLQNIYEELLSIDSKNPELRFEFAEYLKSRNLINEAIKEYNSVSQIYESSKNFSESIKTLLEIEKLTPEDTNLLIKIGRLEKKINNADKAFEYLFRGAKIYVQSEELTKAVNIYLECLELFPNNEQALLDIANIYERLNQKNYAIESYLRTAEIRFQEGRDSENIEILLKVLNIDSSLSPIRERLAQLYESRNFKEDAFYHYMILGENLEAQNELEHAIKIYQHLKKVHDEAKDNRERLVKIYQKLNNIEKAKEELNALAEICIAMQNIEEAEKYFNRIKEIDPNDYKIIELLGQLYESKGDILSACAEYTSVANIYEQSQNLRGTIGALERVKNLDPINTTVRNRLFNLKLKINDLPSAMEEGINLVSLFFQTGSEDEAIALIDNIGNINPQNVSIRRDMAKLLFQYGLNDRGILEYESLSKALLEEERYDESIDILKEGIEISPESVSLHRLKVRAYLGLNQVENAIGTLKNLADIFSAIGKFDEEEKVYLDILNISPKDTDTHKGLISIYKLSNQKDKAIFQLIELSNIYKEQNNLDEAIVCYKDILSLDESQLKARDFLSQLLVITGRNDEAIEQLFILSQNYEKSDDFEQSRKCLGKILELNPESTEALKSLIIISDKLKDKVRKIQYSLKLAEIFEKLKATTDALHIYLAIIKDEPEHFEAIKKVASLYEVLGDTANIVHTYSLLAEKYQKKGAFGEAIQNLKKILEYEPDNVSNLRNLAKLHLRMNDKKNAIKFFEKSVNLLKSSQNWQDAASVASEMVSVDNQRTESHEDLAQCFIHINNFVGAVGEFKILANLYEKSNELEKSIESLKQLLDLSPQNTDDREKYAQLLNKTNHKTEAIEQYLILAKTYSEGNNLEDATSCCKRALSIDPNNVSVRLTTADIYLLQSDFEKAVHEIEWLIQHFLNIDDYPQAGNWLKKGIEIIPDNLSLRELAVTYYKAIGSFEEAVEHYLKITELALLKADYKKAIEALEGAKELVPENIEMRRNLAEIYLRTNQKEQAQNEQFFIINLYLDQGLVEESREITDSMLKQDPFDVNIRIKLAEIYERHFIPELAAIQYVEIAKIYHVRQDYQIVKDYVSKVLNLKPKNIEARELLIDAALKTKQINLAYQTYDELGNLYLENMVYEKAASVLMKMKEIKGNDPKPRERLVSIFNKTNQKLKEFEELYDLAALYVSLNHLEDAVSAYKTLLDYKPDDTQVRIKYIDTYSQIGSELELVPDFLRLIDSYIKHGAVVEATKTFEKIIKIDPNNTECREKFIRFLLKNVQNTRALEEIFTLADIFISQGSFKKAINVLNEGAKISPDDHEVHLKLSEAYNRMNAKGMALNELKIVAKLYQEKNMGKETIPILKKIIEIDSQNLDIRKELIDTCLKYNQISEVVEQSMKLADVYISRGMLDLAEKEYRRITKIDPENITAWDYLIETYLQIGLEEDLVDEYATLGDIYLRNGSLKDSLKYFKKVLEINPSNIEIRKKYIDTYLQIGLENDLVDDYLILADNLVKNKQVDEAINYYSHILAIDPNNKDARNKLAETQEKLKEGIPQMTGALTLADALDSAKGEDPMTRMMEALDNYENVIKMNPTNANAHCKLADVLEQLGRHDEAYVHLEKASEIFFTKGETRKCIVICERLLKINPADGKIRDRLSKAELKKDAFKALESAILASDTHHPKTDNQNKKSK